MSRRTSTLRADRPPRLGAPKTRISRPSGPASYAAPRTGWDAHHVLLLDLDDLVVELHPPAPARDHVQLLLLLVRVAVREAEAGRDALVAEAGFCSSSSTLVARRNPSRSERRRLKLWTPTSSRSSLRFLSVNAHEAVRSVGVARPSTGRGAAARREECTDGDLRHPGDSGPARTATAEGADDDRGGRAGGPSDRRPLARDQVRDRARAGEDAPGPAGPSERRTCRCRSPRRARSTPGWPRSSAGSTGSRRAARRVTSRARSRPALAHLFRPEPD